MLNGVKKMDCKAVCTGIDKAFGPELKEQIDTIKKAGFDGVFADWMKDEDMNDILNYAKNAGLDVIYLHAPFYGMDDLWHDDEGSLADKMLNDLYGCADCCAENNIEAMVCHAVIGMDNHSPNALGIERLAKIVEYTKEKGVKIAFENTEGPEYLQMIFDNFGHFEHIGFCFDSGHEMCYNAGIDMLARHGKKLIVTHLNDNMGQTEEEITFHDDNHMLPFDGIGDWKNIAERMHKCGYTGPLSFELVKGNRPERNTNDRYVAMTFEEYINEAYERADRFRIMYNK